MLSGCKLEVSRITLATYCFLMLEFVVMLREGEKLIENRISSAFSYSEVVLY